MDAIDNVSHPPSPFFHEASETVRFWVVTGVDSCIGASIRRDTLRYLFDAGQARSEPVALYLQNRTAIDAAVLRRLAAGSLEPVMLREPDLSKSRPA